LQKKIGLDEDYEKGTLVWLETPLNPTGIARDISHCEEEKAELLDSEVADDVSGL
jgi:cystathionine beta-lyase/cystathionine gamma-synthase